MNRRVPVVVMATLAFAIVVSPPAAAGSSDQAIAEDALLTAADVPSFFEEQPPDEDDDNQFTGRACVNLRKAVDAVDAAANAEVSFEDSFEDAFTGINNKVAVLMSVKRAKAAYKPWAADNTIACIEQAYEAAFAEEGAAPTVEFSLIRQDGGDDGIGYEGTATDGTDVLHLQVRVLRADRGLAMFVIVQTNQPPPREEIEAMVATVVERLDDGLAA